MNSKKKPDVKAKSTKPKKLTANVPNTLPGLSIDYTGRTQVEEALRVLSTRQEAILAAIPDILIEVDNDEVITWANPAGVKFYGKDVIGKEVSFFFEGEQKTFEIVEPLFDGSDDVIYVESWQRRKDGEKRLLAWHCRSLKDTKGNVTGALSSGKDITAGRQAEKELHLLSDTQRQIAQQENLAEIFKLVGINVQELIGDGYVGISWLDEQEQVMKIIGLYGFGSLYASLVRRFKVDPTKLTYPLKDLTAYELRLFRSGSLEKFEKGLYQLMMRKVPKLICQASEKALKITGIYTMGFILHDLHLGGISILAKRDITPFKESIETIVNQATIVMHRIKAETSLRTSEANLRLVTDNMQDLVVRTDLEGLILYASPSNQTVLGYETEYLLGKSIYDFMHPEDIDRVREFTLASLQAQKAGKQELRYRHADGHYLWLESSGAIIFDEGGSPAWAVFSSRDITERKRVEAGLHTSEQQYLTLVEEVKEGFYICDLHGSFTFVNHALVRILGFESSKAVIGRSFLEFVPPGIAGRLGEQYQAAMVEGKESGLITTEIIRQDGVSAFIEIMPQTIVEDGRSLGSRGTVRDITERKRAEEEIVSLAKFPSENPGFVLRLSRDGTVMFANTASGALLAMWGCPVGGFAPQFWCDLAAHVLASGDNKTIDIECDGKVYSMFVTPVTESGYVNLYGRDITERKRTEAELQSLLEIMQGMVITEDLPGLLELIRQSLAKVIYAENFFVVFKNKSTDLFEEVFAVDKHDTAMPPSKLERSITSYVFRTGEPLLLTQAKLEELVARGEVELVGTKPAIWMGAPLKTPTETIGVIVVQNYEDPDCYSERDKEFLAFVGAHVSLAIERKRAEEALRESEQRLSFHVENTPMAVVEWDAKFIVTRWSGGAEQIFGWRRVETIGKPIMDLGLIYEEDIPSVQNVIQRLTDGKTRHVVSTNRNLTRDGKVIYCEWYNSVLQNPQGKMVSVLSQILDITERKQAEQALKESENQLRTLTEGTQALLVSVDANGHFIYVNEATAKVLGFANPLDLIGKPYLHFIHSEDRQQVLDSFIKQVNTRQPSSLQEFRIIDTAGKARWFSFLSTLIVNAGQVVGQSGVAVEITERKRAEEEIKAQLEELQRWQNATLGRESRILDLKREVNGLLDKAGQLARYASVESEDQKEK